jgi:hypothetical protein
MKKIHTGSRRCRGPISATLLAAMLAACGGGGGGGGTGSSPTGTPGTGTGNDTGTGTGTSPGTGTGPSAGSPAQLQGLLLGSPFPGAQSYDAAELDLAADALSPLPKSAHSLSANAQPDAWSVSASAGSTGDLVRVDTVGDVDFFDRKTLARTGGFSLSAIAGTTQPSFWSEVKVSPDGQHVLAYWKSDFHQDEPLLAVFDRSGNVVQQGSPVDYDVQSYWHAFDWLPDGRYVFLAGPTLVTATVGNLTAQTQAVTLPSGVSGRGAELSVSPDGQSFAMKLGVSLPDSQGNQVTRGLMFVTDSTLSNVRQLTTMTARAQADDGAVGHSTPLWSPDGKFIAFSIAFPAVGYGFSAPGCPEVIVLPASSQNVAIDGLSDPDTDQFVRTDPRSGAKADVRYCYASMSWIAKP